MGAAYSNGSGDYAIAFTTTPRPQQPLPDGMLDPIFAAVMDSVEEALLNSMFTAVTTTGVRGRVRHAVPHQQVLRRLVTAGRLPTGAGPGLRPGACWGG
ncbi:P1 family peptidase [Micromonospora sp. NBC_01655]|uniref:P1 family peptidase n=1 Tax=Micromonospora sp. NBC_01655 TaxID=2975983 RepID=UPI00225BF86B|nr:P1 family peptidase [Micromonospora sp. NBC_01655]MCX4472662.1 P1 family peptidase [Micromonospora sp. NBC_01655]